MSKLSRKTFNQIVKTLEPQSPDAIAARKAMLTQVLYGCPVNSKIDYTGTANVFTVNLVHTLLNFGEYENELTIITLLTHSKTLVGIDKHPQIDDLCRQILHDLGIAVPEEKPEDKLPAQSQPKPQPALAKSISDIMADFYAAYKDEDWYTAANLLDQLANNNQTPAYFDVEDYRTRITQAVNQIKAQRQAESEYELLRMIVANEAYDKAKQAVDDFIRRFPTYDPDDLKHKFNLSSVPYLLPQPFEWCDIPAGKVTLEAGGYLKEATTFDVEAFQMAKYPITNAQFAIFVEAGGYDNQIYWTDAGLYFKTEEKWTEPRYWSDSEWNGSDYPVGVSWYEACAYTRWLSDVTGEKISLPTEQQWQRAARGDDGREYPWGDEWNESCCNHNVDEKGIGRTTPVTQYPNGASPYGVLDLSGNVWEWCLTDFKTGSQDVNRSIVGMMRGGAWYSEIRSSFRADFRFSPYNRNSIGGLRVSRAYT